MRLAGAVPGVAAPAVASPVGVVAAPLVSGLIRSWLQMSELVAFMLLFKCGESNCLMAGSACTAVYSQAAPPITQAPPSHHQFNSVIPPYTTLHPCTHLYFIHVSKLHLSCGSACDWTQPWYGINTTGFPVPHQWILLMLLTT